MAGGRGASARRHALFAAALFVLSAVAPAQDKPAPPEKPKASRTVEAADAAAAAFRANDAKALESIARRDSPDVWVVADLLVDRGERDVAAALAKSAPAPDAPALAVYVAARRSSPDDVKHREFVVRSNELFRANKSGDALALADAVPAGPEDVFFAQVHAARAKALADLGRGKEAVDEFVKSADACERIGWLARAAENSALGGLAARKAADLQQALTLFQRSADLHGRRGDDANRARRLQDVGAVLAQLSDCKTARHVLEEAAALAEKSGARDALAGSVVDLAVVLGNLGERDAARAAYKRAIPLVESSDRRDLLGDLCFDYARELQLHDGPKAALPWFERAVETRRTLSDRQRFAKALLHLGETYSDLGRHDEAMKALEEAMTVWEALGAEEGVAYVLLRMGCSYIARGDMKSAMALLERALPLAERAPADSRLVPRIQAAMGCVRHEVGDYRASLELYEKAVEAFRKCKATDELDEPLRNLACVLDSLADRRAEAIPVAEEALRTAESNGNRLAIASASQLLGGMWGRKGDVKRATDLLSRALAIQEEIGDLPGAAATLKMQSVAFQDAHDLVQALRCAERSRDVAAATKSDATLADALFRLGSLYDAFGDDVKSLGAYEKALHLHETQGHPDKIGWDLVQVANLRMDRGEYARAQSCLERAQTLFEGHGNERDLGKVLGNMAIVQDIVGTHEKKIELERRALALAEKSHDSHSTAIALGNLADSLRDEDKLDEALDLERRALEIRRDEGDREGMAWSWLGLGADQAARGRFDEALDLYEKARGVFVDLHERDETCTALVDLADLRREHGQIKEALAIYEEVAKTAAQIGDARWRQIAAEWTACCLGIEGRPRDAVAKCRESLAAAQDVVAGFGDADAAAARLTLLHAAAIGVEQALKIRDPAEAFFFLESSRAGALLEAARSRDALHDAVLPPELRDAERTTRAEESRAAWAVRRAVDAGDAAAYAAAQADLVSAHERRESVTSRIQRETKLAADVVAPRIVAMSDVQAALRSDEAFVEYGLAAGSAVAVVVTKKRAELVRLATSDEVRRAAAELHPDDGAADPTEALRKLTALTVAPLALGDDVRRVSISPDDVLAFAPFCAMLDGREVAYVPSATTSALLAQTAVAPGDGVLAVGDPEYETNAKPAAVPPARGGARLLPLPGTRAEARAVGTKVLVGRDANEASLRDALSMHRWRAVHLACHGVLDAERPTASALALTPTGDDDGFLSVLDVYRLRVAADLVVLSACETGRGKVARGEGVLGLTRAFMVAGAPRVIVSLWKVDDAATLALMTKFYELWNPKDGPGEPAATALREAQAFVRAQEKWKHPKYWAAWALWGAAE